MTDKRDSATAVRKRFISGAILSGWIVVAACSTCFAQTAPSPLPDALRHAQPPRSESRLFAPPELRMHDLPLRADDSAILQSHRASPLSSRFVSANVPESSAMFRALEKERSLRPPEPVFKSELGRKIDNAFEPEIIRLGHVRIYCPLVTAIARKNPLALIDPLVARIEF